MESTTGVAGKPVYTAAVLAAAIFAISGFVYSVTRHATDMLAATGSPIVPSHAFYWIQGIVIACVLAYVYRLWTKRCDVHANFMRVPVFLSLVALGLGWILLGHHQLPWATVSVGIGLLVLMLSLLIYATKTTQTVNTQCHPLDVVTPYLPPEMTTYGYVIATTTTLAGWLAVFFYILLVATLFDSKAISSAGSAADILVAFLALVIVPATICYSLLHEPFIIWLTLITVAHNIQGSSLHAVVWVSIGLLAGLSFMAFRDRFLLMSRYHFTE